MTKVSADNIFKKLGYEKLLPLQERLMESGLLDGKNLFISAPTASGKTASMEVALIFRCLNEKVSGIYALPYRALTTERYEFLKENFGKQISIEVRSGDYIDAEVDLSKPTILICTYEKLDKILYEGYGLENIGTICIDEGHFIGDPQRGPRLEGVLTSLMKITQKSNKIQVLVSSATIGNPKKIANWIKAKYVEGKPSDQTVKLGFEKIITANRKSEAVELVKKVINKGGQVLIFVNSKKETRDTAKYLTRALPKVKNTIEVIEELEDLPEPTKEVEIIYTNLLPHGIAIHHASLEPEVRDIIEKGFREEKIKIVVCTTTLAAGVNLPASCVIILEPFRYNYFITKGRRKEYLTPNEILQMLGRTGRPRMVEEGKGIVIFDNSDWKSKFLDLEGLWEKIQSRDTLPVESQMRKDFDMLRLHILRVISVNEKGKLTQDEIIQEFKHTFDFSLNPSVIENGEDLIQYLRDIFERGDIALSEFDKKRVRIFSPMPEQIEMKYRGNYDDYQILIRRNEISCTCRDMKYNGWRRPCKHTIMAFLRGLKDKNRLVQRYTLQLLLSHVGEKIDLIFLVKEGIKTLIEDGLLVKKNDLYELSDYAPHAFISYLRPLAISKVKDLLESNKKVTLEDVLFISNIDRQETVEMEVVKGLIQPWINGEDMENVYERYGITYAEFMGLKESISRCAQAVIKICKDMAKIDAIKEIQEIIDQLNHGVPKQALQIKGLNIKKLGRRTAVHLLESGIKTPEQLINLTPKELSRRGKIRKKEVAEDMLEEAKIKFGILQKFKNKTLTKEQAAAELGIPIYDMDFYER
jgi:replicative superfamily II helicase